MRLRVLTIEQLRDKRQGLVHDARAITEKARDENRALTADEVKAYDALMERVDGLKATIDAQLGPGQNFDTREQPSHPYDTRAHLRVDDGSVPMVSGAQRLADV